MIYRNRVKEYLATGIVLLTGIAVTVAGAISLSRADQKTAEVQFSQLTQPLAQSIQSRFDRYAFGLRAVRGWMGVATQTGAAPQFQLYTQRIFNETLFVGAQGIGLVRLQQAPKLVVEEIEPRAANVSLHGVDLGRDPLLWSAAERARLTGGLTLSLPVTLPNQPGAEQSIFLWLPCYSPGAPVQTTEQRQQAFWGWMFVVIPLPRLWMDLDAMAHGQFAVALYSQPLPHHTALVLQAGAAPAAIPTRFQRQLPLQIGQQRWLLQMQGSRAFEHQYAQQRSLWFLLSGLAVTLLCTGIVVLLGQTRRRAWRLADRMSMAAQEHEAQLRTVFEHTTESILTVDVQGHLCNINPAAEKLFGYRSEEVVGQPAQQLLREAVQSNVPPHEEKPKSILPELTYLGCTRAGRLFPVELSVGEFVLEEQRYQVVLLRDISGRRREEHEWGVIRERLQLALESAGLGIWEWWVNADYLTWDAGMHRLYGTDPQCYRPDRASWSEFVLPEDWLEMEHALQEAMTEGEFISVCFRIHRTDGAIRHIACKGRAIRERDQVRLIGINSDVTVQREAESALRLSEERFALAAQATREGIWDWDPRTSTIWFSPQWKAQFGYTDAELDNSLATWQRLLLPEDRERLEQALLQFSQGDQEHFEAIQHFRHRDGHTVYIHSQAVRLVDAQGQTIRIVGSHADITNLLSQEQQLRESQERLDLALSSAQLGTWDWDQQANQVTIGGIWAGWLRDQRREIEYPIRDWLALIHAQDVRRVLRACVQHWRGLSPRLVCEYRLQHADGQWRWVMMTGQVIELDLKGNPVRMLGVVQDIDERKRAEQMLEEARHVAEMANRTKGEFLANMSHEIRTPLNAIIGFSSLLQESTLTPQQQEFATTIRTSGDLLLALINDLLDFSKIEAGKLELEEIEFDVRTLLEDTLEMVSERASAKGLNLACLVDPSVPLQVMGDPARLRQILLNLLNNAVKFTDHGEVVARARAETETDGWVRLQIQVEDSGIGIAPETQERLFRPFTQADASTTRRFGGTGLGLSICRRLCLAMGGDIGVESTEGQGSVFWFFISVRPTTTRLPDIHLPQDLQGRTVLVLDDFASNRELLRLQLERLGLRAEGFARATDALARLDEPDADFALAIVDMQMPQISGLMFAEAVRAKPRWQGLPLVMLTSLAAPGQAAIARAAHFSAYLAKPVRLSQLLFCIEEALRLQHVPEAQRPLLTVHSMAERQAAARPRILLAEDNLVNQKVAVLMLEKLGCRVDVVADGLAAVAAVVAGHPYDLILMDCQMPELDGYAATEQIRALPAPAGAIPIIALTANAFRQDVMRCEAVGMNGFLAKPVTSDMLRAVLQRWLPALAEPNEEDLLPEVSPVVMTASEKEMPVMDAEQEMARINQFFEEMRTTLGMDIRAETVAAFLPTLAQCLEGMQQGVATSDFNALATHAHKLKGMAAQLGASDLSELAKTIELAAKAQDLQQVQATMPLLQQLASGVAQRLQS